MKHKLPVKENEEAIFVILLDREIVNILVSKKSSQGWISNLDCIRIK